MQHASAAEPSHLLEPPVAARHPDAHQVDGIGTLEDDLKWLRDDARSDENVLSLMRSDNEHFHSYMSNAIGEDLQNLLYSELRGRIQEEDASEAVRRHDFWYFLRHKEALNYPVHCRCPVRNSLRGKSIAYDDRPTNDELAHEEVVLDENVRAAGCDFYDANASVSPNGQLMALAEDTSGDEVFTLRVIDLIEGTELVDAVSGTSGNVVWMSDNATLLYTTKDSLMRPYKVYRFNINQQEQEHQDHVLLFHEMDDAFFIGIEKSRSEDFIFLGCTSQVTSDVHLLRTSDTAGKFAPLVERRHNVEVEAEHSGDSFYLYRRSEKSPNGELLRMPVPDAESSRSMPTPKELASSAEIVIPHSQRAQIEDFVLSAHYMVLQCRMDALPHLFFYDLSLLKETNDHEVSTELQLPYNMRVCEAGLGDCGDFNADVFRAVVTSPATPPTTYDFPAEDPSKICVKRVRPVKGDFDSGRYEVRRVNVPGHDGRKVPATLTWRSDIANLDGTDAAFIEVYGAYGAFPLIPVHCNFIALWWMWGPH